MANPNPLFWSRAALAWAFALTLGAAVFAAEAARRNFNVPAGAAAETLKQFAAQAGREIVFAPEAIGSAPTRAVSGSLTPREALDLMLAGSGLVASQDATTGAFAVRKGAADPNGARAAVSRMTESAANAAARVSEQAVELSPFVVKAESGWNVTETLAGTRLKTDLRDVANQLEMFTTEFMQDLAINNVDDMVIYSLNADSLDEYMQDNNAENGATNLSKKTRVRGLAEATFTRGFFNSSFQSDAYNTDTVTVASGSNPTLFGLGSSAGTIDTSVGRAALRNRASTRLQYTSEDSRRATVNFNRVVIPDTLAFRFDGLWSRLHTFRKPNHDDQERYTFGLLFRPRPGTTVHASYERIHRDGNIAPRNLAMDRVSLWDLAPTVPLSPYRTARPGYDNRANVPANISTTSRIFGTQTGNNPLFVTDASSVPPMNWGRSVTVLNPTADTAFGVPNRAFDSAAQLEKTFMDGSYFPLDANIAGDLRTTSQTGNIKTAYLEQRLMRNLFVELAFNREEFTQEKLFNIAQVKVFVDPNLYLPVVLPGETSQRPNPNFGLMYHENSPNGFWERNISENLRASLSYELNFAREIKRSWARWLGLHRLAAVAEQAESTGIRLSGNMRPRILDDPIIPGINLTPRTTRNWAINASRTPVVRAYFDGRGANVTGPGGKGRGWSYVDASGRTASTTYYDSGLVSATSGKRLGTNNNPATGTARKLDSAILTWQGAFLPDREGRNRLLLTYGHRRDSIQTANADLASRTQDFSGFYPLPEETTLDPYEPAEVTTNRSRGVVIHPLQWLSLSYNWATTFAPGGRSYFDPYGNGYRGAGGESEDYGVRLQLWKGRVSLRYNRFEATDGPALVPTGRLRDIMDNARLIENRVIELDPGLPRINVTDGTQRGFPGNAPAYMVMSSRRASGHEVALDLRPVPQWNIRINGTQAEAVDSDIGVEWKAWVADRLPVWQTVVARNGEVDASGRPVTWNTALLDPGNSQETLRRYYESTVVGSSIAFMNAAEGKRTDGSRGKRANLITHYRFTDGRLRGLSLTGAVRWRPPPTIGYPVLVLPSGLTTLDVNRPFRGRSELSTDVGVGYRGQIAALRGLRYTAQLNVRNILGEGPTIPFRSYTDGSIASLATIEPRLFIFTWGLEF